MNITFVLPPVNMSGGIRVIAIYAKRLAERGHRVTLVSVPRQPTRRLHRIQDALGFKQPLKSHLDGLGLDHRTLAKWAPVTDQDVPDADVVVATWWETAEWVAKLDACKGRKFYFVQHHEIHPSQPVERVHATYRLPLTKIVIARWLADVMREQYGDHDTILVPNSVDHGQFHAPVRGKQPRPTVGFLYSRAGFKRVEVALEAVARLRERFPDLRMLSFGAEQADPVAMRDVEFHEDPPQHTLRDVYAGVDVWLSTSRSEGFNLPAMEAMACRTPVVCTRTGWPEEAVITGVNGALVDVDDARGVADAAADILSMSDERWRTMSQAAFDTVKDSSWERSTKLFEQALASAAPPRQESRGLAAAAQG
jgi:glycosyltransferase involved in cell wall biosynthesis